MSAPGTSAAQTSEVASQVTVQGTVEAVDHTARTVTIRGQQGNLVTVDVPANATRFEAIKVGDTVTATYYDRISVRLKPAGEPAVDRAAVAEVLLGLSEAAQARDDIASADLNPLLIVDGRPVAVDALVEMR